MHTGISKVVVMGDILRPWAKGDRNTSGAFRNVQWLYHLISHSVKKAGLPILAMDWNQHNIDIEYIIFDVAKYYEAKGHLISVPAWSEIANNPKACAILQQQMAPALQGALVVGYEMSKVQIQTLEEMGTPYIDIVLHPVRFAPDILHAFRTNSEHIHAQLQALHFNESHLFNAAAEIKAKVSRYPKTIDANWDSALILGQVWTDRAVSRPEGGFYKIDDFLKAIGEIVHRHADTIYKPHPYESISGQKSEINNIYKSIKVSDINYYTLLCQPSVSCVYGLNSSGLYESRFFEKKSTHLIAPQYQFNDVHEGHQIAPGEFCTLSEAWTDSVFWKNILTGSQHDIQHAKDIMTPNKLRRSMNTDWGFEQINKVVAQQ